MQDAEEHPLGRRPRGRSGVDLLDARPDVTDEPSRGPDARSRVQDACRESTTQIDDIIDDLAVRTLFQPIVHLESGEIVGFEALSRGVAGTDLESPLALLTAASQAGRVGELNWLCRVNAMRDAMTSGLPSTLSWFINTEPAGLDVECPRALRPVLDWARSELRVVLELVERDIEGHVTRLLKATAQAREDAWGVALDDVGAQAGSLALLPFLQPDIVKLDMSLLHQTPTARTGHITAAVRAYAERRGAVILAEGIETAEHVDLARVFGATYGQGYLYGRPATLPTELAEPQHPIPLRQRPRPTNEDTPFDCAAKQIEVRQASASSLHHIVDHLLAQCEQAGDSAVLLALYSSAEAFARDRQRIDALSARNGFTAALVKGGNTQSFRDARYRLEPLMPGSPLAHEAATIVVTPYFAGALLLRESEGAAVAGSPVEFIYSHDRQAVITAGRALLEHLAAEEYGQILGRGHPSRRPAKRSSLRSSAPTGEERRRDTGRTAAAAAKDEPGAILIVHEATKALLEATSPSEVVQVVTNLVRGLGGRVVPADQAGDDALPLDLSFGVQEPLLPVADSVAVARLHLETLLPPFLEDARRVVMSMRRWARLKHAAEHDALTGLLNRRVLDSRLRELRRGDAVAIIDFDFFKKVNDRYGHAAGDAVLGAFGQLLVDSLRGDDIAGRYGGEELVLALAAVQPAVLTRRLAQLSDDWSVMRPYPVTFSAGVAPVLTTAGAALAAADQALYAAKAMGRDLIMEAP